MSDCGYPSCMVGGVVCDRESKCEAEYNASLPSVVLGGRIKELEIELEDSRVATKELEAKLAEIEKKSSEWDALYRQGLDFLKLQEKLTIAVDALENIAKLETGFHDTIIIAGKMTKAQLALEKIKDAIEHTL